MSKTQAADPFDIIRYWNAQRTTKGWWHSFELPDGTEIKGVCDLAGLKDRIGQFPIPRDLRGKRVLDIGTWDGWFAFEMERRGAEVVAVDCWDNPLFREMHARLSSRVDYRQFDMYQLTPDRIGRFDIVLFMGVLYHLKHPLLALERVCALTTDLAAVDSFILREEHRPGHKPTQRPMMEFYETNEMGGQTDNWVGPNLECLLAFCRTAGFARVELRNVIQHSACVACYRKWPAPPPGAVPGPELIDAFHNINEGINFNSDADDSVSIWFSSEAGNLSLDDVRPQVGEFGVRPFHLACVGGRKWQANFKLPPGLAAGWHDVRVRIRESRPSDPKRIAVDIPLTTAELRLTGLCDGKTWIKAQLDRAQGHSISLWIAGLPENADSNNVRVYLGGRRLRITWIETQKDGKPRQMNVEVPGDVESGVTQIGIAVADRRTEPAALLII